MIKQNLSILLFVISSFVDLNLYSKDFLPEKMWVDAKEGLNLRTKPDINSKKITVIPFTSEVRILEISNASQTIDRYSSYWFKIKWKNKQGWVFGGYLTGIPYEKPNQSDYKEISMFKFDKKKAYKIALSKLKTYANHPSFVKKELSDYNLKSPLMSSLIVTPDCTKKSYQLVTVVFINNIQRLSSASVVLMLENGRYTQVEVGFSVGTPKGHIQSILDDPDDLLWPGGCPGINWKTYP